MNNKFLIIDDDINIRKMLSFIIRKNSLGKVVGELDSGVQGAQEILFYNPDIVLIDLLLPVKDGIEIINLAKEEGYKGKFIMISQVEDEDMISKAYESGVIFFIKKPINSVEVINVIKGVCRNIELEKSVSLIKNAVFNIDKVENSYPKLDIDEQITTIFSDIGIVGGIGSDTLRKVIHRVIKLKKESDSRKYQLQDIYEDIAREENETGNRDINKKSIEQRVRRTIQKSLQTIAELGYDDYYNSKFTEYSTLLFDFKQVKQEIRYASKASKERGKINIKKFIGGVITKMNF